ncbi:MAG: NFACT family protein [Gemmatimonadota bacterium]|nr:MAG: NFACT family protein [Gemmatimonadota bacterium]
MGKTSYDTITLRTLVAELKRTIAFGTLRHILQHDPFTFVLAISHRSKPFALLISLHPQFYRAHLTVQPVLSANKAPSFLGHMQEALRNTTITSIQQLQWDRVLIMHLQKKASLLHSNVKLIVELTGRLSNMIVTRSEDDIILWCWKQIDETMCRYRHILPGLKYIPPPIPSGIAVRQADFGQFESSLRSFEQETVLHGLVKTVQALSTLVAVEVLYLADIHSERLISSLTDGELERLWERIRALFDTVQSGQESPTVYMNRENHPLVCFPIELQHYGLAPKKQFKSISRALEYYYASIMSKHERDDARGQIQTALHRKKVYWERTADLIKRELENARQGKEYQRKGELLVANMGLLKRGLHHADVIDYYHSDRPHITIELDPKLSPQENAKAYFRKAKKAKTAKGILEKRLLLIDQNLERLQTYSLEFERAKDQKTLLAFQRKMVDAGILSEKKPKGRRTASQKRHFRTFCTSSGWDVLVGRNNKENDIVTFHLAAPNDLWFHARGTAGSHVVLRRRQGREEPDKATIHEAASVAAYFSKSRTAAFVPVSYTERRYVRKPKGAAPGTVIIEREKTLMVEPKLPQG